MISCYVLGVSVAAACMLTSHYLGSHVPDAVGSLIIASLLGSVASFMIYTNSAALGKHKHPRKGSTACVLLILVLTQHSHCLFSHSLPVKAVFRDILVQIRILGSVPLTYGSESCFFVSG
jgi:hypothetical protein